MQKEEKAKKMSKFLNAYIQEWLAQFASDLVCVLSRYAGTCTANLIFWSRDHVVIHVYKIILCFSCYYTHVVHARHVFLGYMTHYDVS